MKSLILFAILCPMLCLGQTIKFNKIDSLPNNIQDINAIVVDSSKVVWLGTNHGLVRIHNNETKVYWDPEKPSKYKINKIVVDNHGVKWLGTYTSSLIRFDDKGEIEETSFLDKTGGQFQLVNQMQYFNNKIWMITSDDYIISYDIATKKTTNFRHSVKGNIYSMYVDTANVVWIGSTAGLYYSSNLKKWHRVKGFSQTFGISKNGNDKWAFGRDPFKRCVLMYKVDYSTVLLSMTLNTNSTWSEMVMEGIDDKFLKFNGMDFDEKGFIWIATSNGIIKYDPIKGICVHFNKKTYPKFKVAEVSTIAVQDYKTIWVTTSGKTIYRIDLVN